MSRFRHALQDRDQHILTLRVFSGVLAGLLLMVTLGWMSAPDRLTIHNPPDLRSGSTRPWWESSAFHCLFLCVLHFPATECPGRKTVRWIIRQKFMPCRPI